ncbi:MAG: signal peptidase I [Clostridia bacterium]|nr:signal peptidase I [Clostridia bacterium]
MEKDKIKVYILEFIICIIFFFTLFVSSTYLRTITAVLLVVSFFVIKKLLHKRNIVSVYNKQATMLLMLLGIVFLLIFYALGIYFGYTNSVVKLSLSSLIKIIIPTTVIVIVSEMLRSILLAEKSLLSKILTTICMVLMDLTIYTSINQLKTFDGLVNAISFSLVASISGNLLWNYSSIRFGYKPAIVFRLIMTLYEYIIPVTPNVFTYFRSFLRMIYPYIIYLILEMLYSKNNFTVAVQDKKKNNIITGILLAIMVLFIMLISCEFKYGLIVIATGSMKGTIDVGDAVVYESYEGQNIKEQQVIIFEKDNVNVVHRVIDIKQVNGVNRYYTKGDANKLSDSGFVTPEKIVGIVKFKVKYIGYPTIMLREMF